MKRIILALLLVSWIAFAEEQVIAEEQAVIQSNKVEMIVFKNHKADDEELIAKENLDYLEKYSVENITFLDEDLHSLKEQADKISSSKNYSLVFHEAWYQDEQKISFQKKQTDSFVIGDVEIKPTTKNIYKVKIDFGIADLDSSNGEVLAINQNLRVKNKELYYLDHPLYGVLFLVSID